MLSAIQQKHHPDAPALLLAGLKRGEGELMGRKALDRLQNTAGHHYQWYAAGNCHVCADCGTAEHRNGRFYYVGRWSKDEPPCEGNHIARKTWLDASHSDDDKVQSAESVA